MDPDCAGALPFENRAAAGDALGPRLFGDHWPAPAVVLALPRGGVPVAKAVSRAPHWPLDVLVVRKIGHPDRPELAIGAVASDGIAVRNDILDPAISSERFEPPLSLVGKTDIVVDDGLATGATMRAALTAAKAMGAVHLVAAVPVGSHEAADPLDQDADEVICLYCPEPFQAVGVYYANFGQLRDADVRAALAA